MKKSSRRLLYINLNDWVWWAWTLTTILLVAGLCGYDSALTGATAVTAAHGLIVLARDRSLVAYSVQFRVAYLLLLLICYLPSTRWLYWLIAAGTFTLIIFGYCFLYPRSVAAAMEQPGSLHAGSFAPDILLRPRS